MKECFVQFSQHTWKVKLPHKKGNAGTQGGICWDKGGCKGGIRWDKGGCKGGMCWDKGARTQSLTASLDIQFSMGVAPTATWIKPMGSACGMVWYGRKPLVVAL